MSEAVVTVKNLHKSFGENEILKGIDFAVRRGEVVSVIGSSGSGKSTLLRCVNLLEWPTSGEIWFQGKNVLEPGCNITAYRAKMGMVFQQFNLFNNLTVLDNCMVGQIRVGKKNKRDAKLTALEYLEKVGMSQYVNAKPHQISGGQKQRVAIARALSMEPDALLFDEPTSALDPEVTGDVVKVIRKLADDGYTMILVTHEIALAREVAERIVYMDNGKIVAQGSPAEILDNPDNERLQAFLKAIL